jgi:hypothetical protein
MVVGQVANILMENSFGALRVLASVTVAGILWIVGRDSIDD